jgi:hypothetical protein
VGGSYFSIINTLSLSHSLYLLLDNCSGISVCIILAVPLVRALGWLLVVQLLFLYFSSVKVLVVDRYQDKNIFCKQFFP